MTQTLIEMLAYKRPSFSKTENNFIDRYIRPLDVEEDAFGNLHLDIGDKPNVVWSSHTDTVHLKEGFQSVRVRNGLARSRKSNCLGADCTTGVWLMTEMIKARVPGRYIFHRDEEWGGNGSSWLAKHRKKLFQNIDFAIAFDRRGKNEVITHMGGLQTASDAFANSLAAELGGGFRRSSSGMFTDTENYRKLVPECTNISIGYEGAHRSNETQDLAFASQLLNKLIKLDTKKLVVDRDPHDSSFSYTYTYTSYETYVRLYPEYAIDLLGIDEKEFKEYVKQKEAQCPFSTRYSSSPAPSPSPTTARSSTSVTSRPRPPLAA